MTFVDYEALKAWDTAQYATNEAGHIIDIDKMRPCCICGMPQQPKAAFFCQTHLDEWFNSENKNIVEFTNLRIIARQRSVLLRWLRNEP